MGQDLSTKPVPILYIGRPDPTHDKLWEQLQREGISVASASTQKAGIERAQSLQPQVVVINLTDAEFSGLRLCQLLGRRAPGARRLLLADRTSAPGIPSEQRLIRPFTSRKLRDTLFRLLQEAAPHMIETGCLQLDVVARVVTGPLGPQRLTPKQCHLLNVFMERPNQVISRKDLMDQIWETQYLGDTRTLDVHIRWLREKIELDPDKPAILLTKRGIGYVLTPGIPPPSEEIVLDLD